MGPSCDLLQTLAPAPIPHPAQGGPSAFSPPSPSLTPVAILLQLIKEKLLDLLGKEEDEGSHDENVVRAAPMQLVARFPQPLPAL